MALAKGGEYGVFEGRIISLAHPPIMAVVYAASAWAAFTGYQWRRLREIGNEISALKAQKAEITPKLEALTAEGVFIELPEAHSLTVALSAGSTRADVRRLLHALRSPRRHPPPRHPPRLPPRLPPGLARRTADL